MTDVNYFELIWLTFEKMVTLFQILYEFLFSQIEILGYEFSLWSVLGGGLISVLLVAFLIKQLVPVA